MNPIEWAKMVDEGLKEDEIRNGWKKRIEGGIQGVKTVRVTYELIGGGFAIDSYHLPFEKDRMKDDLKVWTKLCTSIDKYEYKLDLM